MGKHKRLQQNLFESRCRKDIRHRVPQEYIDSISDVDKAWMRLYFDEHQTQNEVAKQLNVTQEWVAIRIHQMNRRLENVQQGWSLPLDHLLLWTRNNFRTIHYETVKLILTNLTQTAVGDVLGISQTAVGVRLRNFKKYAVRYNLSSHPEFKCIVMRIKVFSHLHIRHAEILEPEKHSKGKIVYQHPPRSRKYTGMPRGRPRTRDVKPEEPKRMFPIKSRLKSYRDI